MKAQKYCILLYEVRGNGACFFLYGYVIFLYAFPVRWSVLSMTIIVIHVAAVLVHGTLRS